MQKILNDGAAKAYCGDGVQFYRHFGDIPHTLVFDPPWDAGVYIDPHQSCRSVLAFADGGRSHDVIELFGAPTWVFAWDCISSWYTPSRPLKRMKICFWYGDINKYQQKGHLFGGPCGSPRIVRNSRSEYLFTPDAGKMLSDVFQHPITKLHSHAGSHKHSKPFDWVCALIANTHEPGSVIVDPFFGGGVTLAAARHLGIEWHGCEIDPDTASAIDEFGRPPYRQNPEQRTLL